jgi:hypothetical protein
VKLAGSVPQTVGFLPQAIGTAKQFSFNRLAAEVYFSEAVFFNFQQKRPGIIGILCDATAIANSQVIAGCKMRLTVKDILAAAHRQV